MFEQIEWRPRVLRDVTHVDLGTEVLGARVEPPFGIAPTGFTRMMHHEGEIAGGRLGDRRNGLTIPPALTQCAIIDASRARVVVRPPHDRAPALRIARPQSSAPEHLAHLHARRGG